MRKLGAWLNLAWHFARYVLGRWWLRPFRRGRDLARLEGRLAPEGYLPVLPAERELFPRSMQCIHCGLCAIACPTLQHEPASAWQEAWTFAAGAARSLDQARLVARDIGACPQQTAAEAVCPMGVPITHMAAMMQRMAQ